ncbi:MAG: sugar ABC transporter substrate-binding protein, partial [Bauldia litoralis]
MNCTKLLGAAALIGLAFTSAAVAQDDLSIGIVTFSSSDVDTNQMIDTMTEAATSQGWSVE